MAYLHIRPPHAKSIRHEVHGHAILGRAIECDVWINDPRLSRMHCRVEHDGTHWIVTDLNSRNGTFVAGKKIEDHQPLADGEEFEIGDTRITFHEGALKQRPTDPIAAGLSDSKVGEAIGTGHGHAHGPGESMSGTRFATHVSVMPAAVASPGDSTVAGAVSSAAAFRRPPATPQVETAADERLQSTGIRRLPVMVTVLVGLAAAAILCLWLYLLL